MLVAITGSLNADDNWIQKRRAKEIITARAQARTKARKKRMAARDVYRAKIRAAAWKRWQDQTAKAYDLIQNFTVTPND